MLPLFTYNYSNTATPPKENFQLDGGQQNRARKTIQNKKKTNIVSGPLAMAGQKFAAPCFVLFCALFIHHKAVISTITVPDMIV